MTPIQIMMTGAAFVFVGWFGIIAIADGYQRDMKLCELTHSHGVCVGTLR